MCIFQLEQHIGPLFLDKMQEGKALEKDTSSFSMAQKAIIQESFTVTKDRTINSRYMFVSTSKAHCVESLTEIKRQFLHQYTFDKKGIFHVCLQTRTNKISVEFLVVDTPSPLPITASN